MKVVVFGASGGVGQHLVSMAAKAGHEVTAVSRSQIDVPSGVKLVLGDVLREGFAESAIAGRDVVLSSLGIKRTNPKNPWSPLASPEDFCSATARSIVEAMKKHGVRRVLAVSAAGVRDSAAGLNWMMRFFINKSNVGKAYRDLAVMEEIYRDSGLDFSCPRPTGLKDGEATGRVAVIEDFPFNAWISRADVARWMIEHIEGDLSALRFATITEARA